MVTKPHVSKELTSASAVKKWILSVIICTIIYSLPFYFRYEIFYFEPTGTYIPRKAKWSNNDVYDILYDFICYFLVLVIVLLSILAFATVQLIRALKESRKKKMNISASQNSKEDVTLSLVIVVIIYAICQIPKSTRHIWNLFDSEKYCGSRYFAFIMFSFTVIHINSAINSIIFFLIGKRFRKKFLDKVQTICGRNKVGPAVPAIETITGNMSAQQNWNTHCVCGHRTAL